jgi:NAD(P)-dependent dehydrogenase (short-subunit alcohol dehydrogenase family)
MAIRLSLRRDAMRKTWMITGSSVGLGRAIAEGALARGDRVLATARNPATLDDLASRFPDTLHRVALDVVRREDWRGATEAALARFAGVDVLVNNAGFGAIGSVEDMPIDAVRELIETNWIGTVHACQAILPVMRAQRHGHVILISSIGARIATAGAGFYYASKAAVSALAESLALEVEPLGIRVTAVEPGGMRTRFAEPSSLKIMPWHQAYDPTVGAIVGAITTPDYTPSLEDPREHAALVLKVADLDAPPVRLLAGADALERGLEAAQRQAASDSRWSDLSRLALGIN